ncbi:hypothetical protein SCLCIDRAFT_349723 [Scleroderma citrinum Foug A]|uniref:Uncharacterized protein n=1 Tax=Scleroderma citrinum Foug A TaxID=1036808 RepID=A0A0C3D1D2_9AGAM|nr:hypothetical protein SCLCIDRAFT_349723 [Scleroderma citrinum Foug A]
MTLSESEGNSNETTVIVGHDQVVNILLRKSTRKWLNVHWKRVLKPSRERRGFQAIIRGSPRPCCVNMSPGDLLEPKQKECHQKYFKRPVGRLRPLTCHTMTIRLHQRHSAGY